MEITWLPKRKDLMGRENVENNFNKRGETSWEREEKEAQCLFTLG